MRVTLFIEGKPIESRFIPDYNLYIPGYMQGLQIDMMEQNEDIIDLTNAEPEFVVSEINAKKNIERN